MGSICKIEKEKVADALFGCGVSARQRKRKLQMQIFEGEYLRDREKASCGCIFLQGSICKIAKRQVADAYFCILTEKSICKGIL